jgi:DNA-binding CsgD family transcriptional regulator
MYLAPSTVRNHLTAVFRKFGVNSQAELIEALRG